MIRFCYMGTRQLIWYLIIIQHDVHGKRVLNCYGHSNNEMQKKMAITKKLTCCSAMLCACCIVHHLQWSILQAILPDNPSIEQGQNEGESSMTEKDQIDRQELIDFSN
jgi:hypothetical protein